uniref:Uncharacterized protein n=1 Tax=Arundo donax TaxID=35708 RepID=A0A0A8ZM44_ARUDO
MMPVTRKDDTVLLAKALDPADQTLCSGGELHHVLDGTPKPDEEVDVSEIEVDTSGFSSTGVKKEKRDGGNPHVN